MKCKYCNTENCGFIPFDKPESMSKELYESILKKGIAIHIAEIKQRKYFSKKRQKDLTMATSDCHTYTGSDNGSNRNLHYRCSDKYNHFRLITTPLLSTADGLMTDSRGGINTPTNPLKPTKHTLLNNSQEIIQ